MQKLNHKNGAHPYRANKHSAHDHHHLFVVVFVKPNSVRLLLAGHNHIMPKNLFILCEFIMCACEQRLRLISTIQIFMCRNHHFFRICAVMIVARILIDLRVVKSHEFANSSITMVTNIKSYSPHLKGFVFFVINDSVQRKTEKIIIHTFLMFLKIYDVCADMRKRSMLCL